MAITFGDYHKSKGAKLAGSGGSRVRVAINKKELKQLDNFMKRFPKILQTPKNLERIFRKNSKPLQNKIKQKISGMPFKKGTVGSRQLEESVGFITTKASREYGGGYVGLRVKGAFANREKSGFYGAWIEMGKDARKPTYKWGPAKPFIRPAYNETKRKLMFNMLTDARSVMYKQVKKLRREGTLGYK